MLGKKKQSKERRSNESHQQLLNMGLVPNNDDSDDDAALEAELQKLMYGGSKGTKPKKRKKHALRKVLLTVQRSHSPMVPQSRGPTVHGVPQSRGPTCQGI